MAAIINVEHTTLVQCTEKLCSGISQDPLIVTLKLFEKQLVSEAQVTNSLSKDKDDLRKATELVIEMTRLIGSFPEKFDDFISVLKEFPWLQDVVKCVLGKYEDIKAKVQAIPAGPEDKSSEYNDDTIQLLTKANIFKMEAKFAALITNIAERLSEINMDFVKFRQLVAICFQEKKDSIATATSFIKILEILSSTPAWKCLSCIHIEVIFVALQLNDTSLQKLISDFKIELAGFYASTKIINFMRCMKPKEINEEAVPGKSAESSPDDDILVYRHKLSVKLKADITAECMAYFDKLWNSIRVILLLQPLPVLLQDICKGCIEVTWLIRPITATEILDKHDKFPEVAKEFELIQVTLDGDYFLYRDYLAKDSTFKKLSIHEMRMIEVYHPEALQIQPGTRPKRIPMADALPYACLPITHSRNPACCVFLSATGDLEYEIDYGKLLLKVAQKRRLIRAYISEFKLLPPDDSIWSAIGQDRLTHVPDLSYGMRRALQHHIKDDCMFIVVAGANCIGDLHFDYYIKHALMLNLQVELWSMRHISDKLRIALPSHPDFTFHTLDNIILHCTRKEDDHSERELLQTQGGMQVAKRKLAESLTPKEPTASCKKQVDSTPAEMEKSMLANKPRCKYEDHCQDGAECTYAHTEYEKKLFSRFPQYPAYNMRYFKTKLCCNREHKTEEDRRWCFYAHDDSDSWCLNCAEYGHLTEFCTKQNVS